MRVSSAERENANLAIGRVDKRVTERRGLSTMSLLSIVYAMIVVIIMVIVLVPSSDLTDEGQHAQNEQRD